MVDYKENTIRTYFGNGLTGPILVVTTTLIEHSCFDIYSYRYICIYVYMHAVLIIAMAVYNH